MTLWPNVPNRRLWLQGMALVLATQSLPSRAASVLGVRIWPARDYTRVTIESDVPLQTQVQFIEEPPRLAVDIQGLVLDESLRNLVRQVRPHQVTFVPDSETQFTSDHGWRFPEDAARLRDVVREAQDLGARVSLFMDADARAMGAASEVGADRVELYTEPYAQAHGTPMQASVLAMFSSAALAAQHAGLEVNAGHDLNLHNLRDFLAAVPHVKEVSIGHALMADALETGYDHTVRAYIDCLTP